MPAGDLITADWQIELRGLLTGDTTVYDIDSEAGGISGLGEPEPKTSDVALGHDDGDASGAEYSGPRIITVAYEIILPPADAMAAFVALKTAWATASTADIELHLQVPSWGHLVVTGRPRGLVERLGLAHFGQINALARFKAHHPAITVVP